MNAVTQQETSSIQFTDGRVSIYQPENKDLIFPYEKKFNSFAEEMLVVFSVACCFRLFQPVPCRSRFFADPR